MTDLMYWCLSGNFGDQIGPFLSDSSPADGLFMRGPIPSALSISPADRLSRTLDRARRFGDLELFRLKTGLSWLA